MMVEETKSMERLEAGRVPIHTSTMTLDGRIFGISILEEIPKEIANFCCSSIHDEEDEHSSEEVSWWCPRWSSSHWMQEVKMVGVDLRTSINWR